MLKALKESTPGVILLMVAILGVGAFKQGLPGLSNATWGTIWEIFKAGWHIVGGMLVWLMGLIFSFGVVVSLWESELVKNLSRKKSLNKKSTKAPKILLQILSLLVPKQDRENMFGDLDENFPKLQKRIGRRMATLVYLKDIVSMALPSIQKLVLKIGLVTGLWEFIKRKLL
jgi:hypothetical protein